MFLDMNDIERQELIERVVDRIVDDMDTGTLVELVRDLLLERWDAMDNDSLIKEVTERYPELL